MVATERAHVDVIEDYVREQVADLLAAVDDGARSGAKWLGEAYDRGLAWVDFPVGLGGLGAHHRLQDVVDAELAAAGASLREATRNVVGFGMAAPVLVQYASRE